MRWLDWSFADTYPIAFKEDGFVDVHVPRQILDTLIHRALPVPVIPEAPNQLGPQYARDCNAWTTHDGRRHHPREIAS